MSPSRQCLKCGRLTRGASYCRACNAKREKARVKQSPWIKLYSLPSWNYVKWSVHKRDGYRCTYTDARGRCTMTTSKGTIEAHHVRKVRQLWLDAKRSWPQFERLALDPSNIVTLCYRHHQRADGREPGRLHDLRLSAPRKRSTRPASTAKTGRIKR